MLNAVIGTHVKKKQNEDKNKFINNTALTGSKNPKK
jgi:hypothetical protein